MICLLILASILCATKASPIGAPVVACETMEPQHGAEAQDPDTVITTLTAEDNGDGTYNVTLAANDENVPFKGVFLQARREGSTEAQGVFSEFDQDVLQPRPCPRGAEANGLTHVRGTTKTMVSALWSPPAGETGSFQMMATIVEINSGEEIRHWVGQSVDINVE